MLTSKKSRTRRPKKLISFKASSLKATVYQFPEVEGLEDVSATMATIKAETLFSALVKGYDLSPIESEEQAQVAERFLEYLLRAFEKKCPAEVKTYIHLLEMLVEEYDKRHTIATIKHLSPHQILRAILEETGVDQKSLVPSCFKSQSQVSEFLSQKKGREKLTAEQAIKLGKRFHLDPLLFLRRLE
jgi:antitoxin component HigA of HigAB toxin-antitoxin module